MFFAISGHLLQKLILQKKSSIFLGFFETNLVCSIRSKLFFLLFLPVFNNEKKMKFFPFILTIVRVIQKKFHVCTMIWC